MDSQINPSDTVESTNTQIVDKPEPTAFTNRAEVNQPLQKGRQVASQSSAFVLQLFDSLRRVFQSNKQLVSIIALLVATFIAIRIFFAILDTLDDIPLLPLLFELVGIGYSIWFVNRYLLKTSARQELSRKVQELKQQILGSQQALTNSAATPQSVDGADLVNSLDVKKTVTVAKSPEELYHFWRNFENLPHFMEHIESVAVLDEKRSHWVARGPLDTNVEWDAEIIQEDQPKTIVWRTVGGAEIDSVGSVSFVPANGSGTAVKVTMKYAPPNGVIGTVAAAVLGNDPEQQLEEDLNRFKRLMEAPAVETSM